MKSKAPRPKIAAAGVAGALTVLIVYLAGLAGLAIPEEVAAAVAALLAFAAGYLTPED